MNLDSIKDLVEESLRITNEIQKIEKCYPELLRTRAFSEERLAIIVDRWSETLEKIASERAENTSTRYGEREPVVSVRPTEAALLADDALNFADRLLRQGAW